MTEFEKETIRVFNTLLQNMDLYMGAIVEDNLYCAYHGKIQRPIGFEYIPGKRVPVCAECAEGDNDD